MRKILSVLLVLLFVCSLAACSQKENNDDLEKLRGYFQTVIRDKGGKEGGLWNSYYEARKYLR